MSTTLTVGNSNGEADWLICEARERGLWTGAIVEEMIREKINGRSDLRISDGRHLAKSDGV